MWLIDKLFLVKKIVSREGQLHFRRWRLIQTPWFAVFIHHIARSDEDKDPHSHPFNFTSFILRGGYQELVMWWDSILDPAPAMKIHTIRAGEYLTRRSHEFHKITLLDSKPVWSLVFIGRRTPEWGYLTKEGRYYESKQYRKMKHANSA